MGRPKKSEKTEQVRAPESFVRRVRRIAAHRGQDPGDYMAERFAALLDEDEKAMVDDIKKEMKEKPK
jgi:hypothetical protein